MSGGVLLSSTPPVDVDPEDHAEGANPAESRGRRREQQKRETTMGGRETIEENLNDPTEVEEKMKLMLKKAPFRVEITEDHLD